MAKFLPLADAVFPLCCLPFIPDISADALRVLLVLVAAQDGEYTKLPSVDEIAMSSEQDEDVIKSAISELSEHEVIEIRENRGSPLYTIHVIESYCKFREFQEMSEHVEQRVYEIFTEANRDE